MELAWPLELLAAVEEVSSACECGMHTESGWTVKPSISDKCGNSVYCGRWGMGATLSCTPAATAWMSGFGGVQVGVGAEGDAGRLMAIWSGGLTPKGGSTMLGSQ